MLMVFTIGNTQVAEAASKYITVEDYIKYIVDEMNWNVDTKTDDPYIKAAINKGILKEGDFKNYKAYLTRTDAAVIANLLDELINQKYGYPQDVYEFLRDCNLYNNMLYYSTEGNLYPEGATRETYFETVFHEDVVMPILGEYFKDDNWKDSGLRTRYYYVTDSEANILKRYMEIGIKPKDIMNFVGIESFDKDSEIVRAWNTIKDGERKVNAVLEKRISDIKDIPKDKREAVASIVAKGIIKGYNNGLYVQNREFRGNNKITDKGAKDVIQKVLNPKKRAQISPDGQLIRTTNLPKNASDYAYILESFPNEYYEMKYSFMFLTDYLSGTIRDDEYTYPKKIDYDYLYNKFYDNKMYLEIDKYDYYDESLLNTEKYLQHVFNVDYRTVNSNWKEGLESSFCQYAIDNRVYRWIDRYVESMKKNNVVVEFENIAIDPGAIYESRDYLYIRAYVKYRITADDVNVPTNELVYGDYNNLKGLSNGKWNYEIFDIRIDSRYGNNDYQWGPTAQNLLSNWQYRESFK